ncbi:hypothetical protein RND81_06G200700 [Saponaria officinalis]|uniref:Uncharacterized protein n=1 Tax=Saponaria officinalis TaxID=3572 RepID=A0AAW1KD25_SAPOF
MLHAVFILIVESSPWCALCCLNQYILTLEGSLQEEMSCHAPLYDVGLKDLTMKELETLARIHEEGLHQIHALQH